MKRGPSDDWHAKSATKRQRSEMTFASSSSSFKPSVADVQNLVLRCLTEDQGENPKWVFIKNVNNIKNATVCLVPNMDILQLKNKEHVMPTMWNLYAQKGQVMRPMYLQRKTSLLRELLASKAASRIPYGYSHPAAAYIASAEELERNRFPPGCYGGPMEKGWVRSSPSSAVPDMNNLLGIDCEMVETDQGSGQLARLSVVDQTGAVLMDRLCRPPGRVTNYLTQYSGITEEMLKTSTLTLADLQEELLMILKPNSVLVGHSLENDLWSLKLIHPHLIDTALLFPHQAGWPKKQSLQKLGMQLLKKKLDRTNGHNSIEDARLAMLLVMTKIQKGPCFGILSKADRVVPLGALLSTHIFEEDSSTLPETWLIENSVHFQLSDNISDWPQLLKRHRGQVNIITLRTFQTGGGTDESAKALDRQIKSILEILEENELFIILTCGDLEDYWKLVDDQRQLRLANQNTDSAVALAREELLQRKIQHSRGRLDHPLGIFTFAHKSE